MGSIEALVERNNEVASCIREYLTQPPTKHTLLVLELRESLDFLIIVTTSVASPTRFGEDACDLVTDEVSHVIVSFEMELDASFA